MKKNSKEIVKKPEVIPQQKKKKSERFTISLTFLPQERRIKFSAPSAVENALQLFLTKVATRVADKIVEKIESKLFRK